MLSGQRSAEAARSTSSILESSQLKAAVGVTVVEHVERVLTDTHKLTGSVSDLVKQAANATRDRSRNIQDMPKATGQLDKRTRDPSNHAGQPADSSAHLMAHAFEMKEAVGNSAGSRATQTDTRGVQP